MLLWTKLWSVLHSSQKSHVKEPTTNDTRHSGDELANFCNKYIINLVEPSSNSSQLVSFQYLNSTFYKSVFFLPCRESEILFTFMNFQNSTSRDINGLQIKPIRYAIGLLELVRAVIFKTPLKRNIFPEQMRIEKSYSYRYRGRNQ